MTYADYGWLAVLGVVLVVEVRAPRGQLLSEGAARYKAAQPIAWTSTVTLVAGHLLGVIPKRADPIHQLARVFGR